MNFALDQVGRYGFNKRILTETDFYNICESEGITVKENQEFSAYLCIDGEPYIALEKSDGIVRPLYIKFHELAHHFTSAGIEPNAIHFLKSKPSKAEAEAHFLAIAALCPFGVLTGEIPFDFSLTGECGTNIASERRRLHGLYGA